MTVAEPLKAVPLCLVLLSGALLFGSACDSQAAVPQDALSRMEVVFKGHHSKEEIKQRLDLAMSLYKVPITEENYSRAGSVLVGLGQDFELDEMAILDYMIRSYVPGVNLTFPDAAALAASALHSGVH